MEAGLFKKYCLNGSGNDETNFGEMKAGSMKNDAEMEAGVMKNMFPEIQAGLVKLMLWK